MFSLPKHNAVVDNGPVKEKATVTVVMGSINPPNCNLYLPLPTKLCVTICQCLSWVPGYTPRTPADERASMNT